VFVVLLAVAVVSAVASLKIADAKGLPGAGYFFLGLFLPIIGLLVVGFMPPAERREVTSVKPQAHPLAVLRSLDDPNVARFLNARSEMLDRALDHCEVGEHVQAFGTAKWGRGGVLFLLTDRQFVLINTSNGRTVTISELDSCVLDESHDKLRFPEGVLIPDPKAPFTAHELAARIRHRQDFEPSVEVIAPGVLARPKPSKVDEPVATSGEPTTDTVGEIERLDALHQSGAIDDDEFAELKRRAMWGDNGPTESSDQTG
jgi:hypothetical protein